MTTLPRAAAASGARLRRVTPEELNVAPALLGLPLARPGRRLLAIAVDLLVIALISDLANAWLLAAVALPAAAVWRSRRRGPSIAVTSGAWILAALCAWAGVQEAARTERTDAPGAFEFDDDDEDAASAPRVSAPARAGARTMAAAGSAPPAAAAAGSVPSAAAAAGSVPSAVAAAGSAPTEADPATVAALQARVHALQTELDQAHRAAEAQARPVSWRERLRRLGFDLGIGYGWALAYFTLLPTWWRGQTLGKRLLGLRVREITGKPMTPLLNFKRFGGYLAGMATGGFGFAQLIWDANRQALQDKAAHTVVIDERAPRADAEPPRP